eukprot:TRINITY_DN93904_c0_g1_i1.p1 TRINITY_DN93904_c0_g1~~TRINITY_DN93904_c0_g1_i1.p1  ORF type:complete len:295 (+),score=65.85 TRINITY_DN93904_c0_g1_i1:45-929(+)
MAAQLLRSQGASIAGGCHSHRTLRERREALMRLRSKAMITGNLPFWHLMDPTIDELAKQLKDHSYVILEGFLDRAVSADMQKSVSDLHKEGKLAQVASAHYIKLVDKTDIGFACLEQQEEMLGKVVARLAKKLPELKGKVIRQDGKYLVSCCEPGFECEPGDCSFESESNASRVLTCVTYLNPDWMPGDGGQSALFSPSALSNGEKGWPDESYLEKIPPLHNRILVFFSDGRISHGVLPTSKARFAVTSWYAISKDETSKAPRRPLLFSPEPRSEGPALREEVKAQPLLSPCGL